MVQDNLNVVIVGLSLLSICFVRLLWKKLAVAELKFNMNILGDELTALADDQDSELNRDANVFKAFMSIIGSSETAADDEIRYMNLAVFGLLNKIKGIKIKSKFSDELEKHLDLHGDTPTTKELKNLGDRFGGAIFIYLLKTSLYLDLAFTLRLIFFVLKTAWKLEFDLMKEAFAEARREYYQETLEEAEYQAEYAIAHS